MRMIAVALALLVATTAGPACNSHESVAVQAPTLAAGEPCPRTRGRTVNDAFGPALGHGPVYPVGLGTGGILELAPPKNFDSRDWGGQKVLWVVDPKYEGPAVIRGRRLDGPGVVRFNRGDVPPAELRIPAGVADNLEGGWRNFPSYTRLESPGCYAYEVKGDGLGYVIVFLARRQSL